MFNRYTSTGIRSFQIGTLHHQGKQLPYILLISKKGMSLICKYLFLSKQIETCCKIEFFSVVTAGVT